MITKIQVQNFKSLENLSLDCSYLNVLTGLNGMGKSSIIQILLLLRQSYERGLLQEGLALNGDLVQIGLVKDALYEFADIEELNFKLDFFVNNQEIKKDWRFIRDVNDIDNPEEERTYSGSDFMPYSTEEDADKFRDLKDLNILSLFKHNAFKYLNADRWVKNEYETSDFNVVRNKNLGKHGQYTAHYLDYFGTQKVSDELVFEGTDNNELAFQVSAWMSYISPGTKVKTERVSGSESIKLRYVFEEDGINTTELKPLNVGFGITYILPVLVALLSAKKGDILVIENPESHVHPKAQSIIGQLIAKVATIGIQIFVETHSDHLLNGIRIAVKNGVFNESIKLFFFDRIKSKEKAKIYSTYQSPVIEQDGNVSFWPDDFFDQAVKDLNYLFDI
ncbi:DUF3696 domain-containing protein [Chryseobacterium binzhouense]|uniref:DUF3696 domain-containing protein n=1 Tax=Chryseobacterium binzhouense TaxID=2593646 RepID=UPI00117ED634|nr:DUF3696 domain-containing protein [Chryseobacterium binzhouense]